MTPIKYFGNPAFCALTHSRVRYNLRGTLPPPARPSLKDEDWHNIVIDRPFILRHPTFQFQPAPNRVEGARNPNGAAKHCVAVPQAPKVPTNPSPPAPQTLTVPQALETLTVPQAPKALRSRAAGAEGTY